MAAKRKAKRAPKGMPANCIVKGNANPDVRKIAMLKRDLAREEKISAEMKDRLKSNKEYRDLDLRIRLDGKKTVNRINMIIDEFTLLDQQIVKARNTKKEPNNRSNRIRTNTARGQLLKTQADLLFRKLNKLLPDIKSVEYTATIQESKPENMPDEKLVDIIKGNISIEELAHMFPQHTDMLKTLEDLELPEM